MTATTPTAISICGIVNRKRGIPRAAPSDCQL